LKEEMTQSLWVEKYRPQTLNDIVLPAHLETMVKKFISENQVANLLLCSRSPGTGKTTLAHAICNDLQAHKLYINVSEENGIDTLRNLVRGYAGGKNWGDKRRIIILDEMEGMTPQAQAAFRGMIEEFAGNASFIMTCNNVQQIIKPLREGRTFEIDMDYHSKEIIAELQPKIAKRLIHILKTEKIEFDPQAIKSLVINNFPSMRTMISLMHSYTLQFGKIDANINSNATIDNELLDLILEMKFNECRTFVKEHALDYPYLYKFLFENLPAKLAKQHRANVILTIADADRAFTSNPEIQFAACLLRIFDIIKGK